MNLGSISSILDLVNKALDALRRFKALFFGDGGEQADEAIAQANRDNKASADIARRTGAEADDEIAESKSQGDADSDRLRNADGLREQRDIVQQAIDRANKKPGADSVMRRR